MPASIQSIAIPIAVIASGTESPTVFAMLTPFLVADVTLSSPPGVMLAVINALYALERDAENLAFPMPCFAHCLATCCTDAAMTTAPLSNVKAGDYLEHQSGDDLHGLNIKSVI